MGTQRLWLVGLLLALASLSSGVVGQDVAASLAWQQATPYVAPDFEAYFPDDVEGAALLDELYAANTLRQLDEEEFLAVIRQGLRRTTNHRTLILSFVGNRLIWNQEQQHPLAIELCYHAADFSEQAERYGSRHYAVYFGLSVVHEKTPAILRTLADLCVAVDDPNDIGRVAWGAADQMDALLPLLEPHLESSDSYVREKAEAVRSIFAGEMGAFEWATLRAQQPPRPEPWEEMPEVREALRTGDSQARMEMLERITAEQLAKDMNDSYLADFAAVADDPDPLVRQKLATLVSGRWIWGAGLHLISDPAVDLALRLSHDDDPDVRYAAVYYGLSTYRGLRDDVLERLVTLAIDPAEAPVRGRVLWALERYGDRLASVLETDLHGEDLPRARAVYGLYRTVLGERPSFMPPGLAGPRDLVGTWVVTVASDGENAMRTMNRQPLTVVQDESGLLELQGDTAEALGGDALAHLIFTEVGDVLHFSFHTMVESAILRSTGRLTAGRIEGTSQWDGGDDLMVWSAERADD